MTKRTEKLEQGFKTLFNSRTIRGFGLTALATILMATSCRRDPDPDPKPINWDKKCTIEISDPKLVHEQLASAADSSRLFIGAKDSVFVVMNTDTWELAANTLENAKKLNEAKNVYAKPGKPAKIAPKTSSVTLKLAEYNANEKPLIVASSINASNRFVVDELENLGDVNVDNGTAVRVNTAIINSMADAGKVEAEFLKPGADAVTIDDAFLNARSEKLKSGDNGRVWYMENVTDLTKLNEKRFENASIKINNLTVKTSDNVAGIRANNLSANGSVDMTAKKYREMNEPNIKSNGFKFDTAAPANINKENAVKIKSDVLVADASLWSTIQNIDDKFIDTKRVVPNGKITGSISDLIAKFGESNMNSIKFTGSDNNYFNFGTVNFEDIKKFNTFASSFDKNSIWIMKAVLAGIHYQTNNEYENSEFLRAAKSADNTTSGKIGIEKSSSGTFVFNPTLNSVHSADSVFKLLDRMSFQSGIIPMGTPAFTLVWDFPANDPRSQAVGAAREAILEQYFDWIAVAYDITIVEPSSVQRSARSRGGR